MAIGWLEDDCEDQACVPTEVCTRFECQSWQGGAQIQPKLVKRGPYWCCEKCGHSYGERAKGDATASKAEGA